MKRLLQAIYSLYAILCYLTILGILSPVFLISSFFGEIYAGNLIYKLCNVWARIWYFLVGIRYEELRIEAVSPAGQYIYVANHSSYADVISVVRAINKPFRVLGRHDIASLPVIGYFYSKAVISVDRSNYISKAFSMLSLRKYVSEGLSVFIFPEGTFNESGNLLKDFYDGAFHLAIDTQTPIKPILFLDNLDRMNPENFLSMSPGKCRVVFMDEIDVKGYNRSSVALLKQKVYASMEQGLSGYQSAKS